MRIGVFPAASVSAGILGVATAFLVLRLPGSVILVAFASIAAVLVSGICLPRRDTWPIWLFLGTAILTSTLSIFIAPAGIALVNFATLAGTFTLFAIAVLCGQAGFSISRVVARVLYYSFGLALAVGWLEVVTGLRLRADSTTSTDDGAFLTSAWFINSNDLAVVIAMFAIMVLLRLLVDARGPIIQWGRGFAYLAASSLIILAGSRGALAGLIAGSALVFLQTLRVKRPQLLSGTAVVLLLSGTGFVSLVLLGSTWIQDTSTQARGAIITRTLELTSGRLPQVWLGWGDQESFLAAASKAFPGVLMDPHNILLEIFVWYGAPTLATFLVLWFVILRRGLWRMEAPTDWTSIGIIILFSLMPLLGTVPSSSLRYYYVFLIAPCAMAILTPGGQRNHREETRDLPRPVPARPLVNEGVPVPSGEDA